MSPSFLVKILYYKNRSLTPKRTSSAFVCAGHCSDPEIILKKSMTKYL